MKKTLVFLVLCLILLTSLSYAMNLTIRKGGSIWAEVDSSGYIRINGSIVGEFDPSNGYVRKNGSIVGEVDSSGYIRKNGSIYGEIESSGYLRVSGSIVGEIESSGYIRKNGSIWGESSSCQNYNEMRAIAAVLVFFSGEF